MDDPFGWQAHVAQDFERDPLRQHARLVIARRLTTGHWQYIEEPQLRVATVQEGERPERAGIVMEPDMLRVVGRAIADWQGPSSHKETEAKILREWLAVERERVDRLLGGHRGQ